MYKLAKIFRFVLPDRHARAYIREIRRSGQFDPVFYRNNYPGLRPIFRRFPVRHYVAIGEPEALRPNPDFSPIFYLHYNPDVRSAGIPPFRHWIEIGHLEGRITKELPEVLIAAAKDMPRLPSGEHRCSRPFAVVAHLFYYDLWDEIAEVLTAARPDADLFFTLTDRGEETDAMIAAILARFPEARCFRFPNRGRDILPFVHLLNAGVLDGYAAVGKIHTKRSPHRTDGDHWRRHLMHGILPPEGLEPLLARFLAEPRAAIWVADGQHYRSEEWWGSNRGGVARLLRRLEIRLDPEDDLAFPAGSMYWLKPVMVAMIKGLALAPDEFEAETSQVDGTVAHAFERTLGFIARAGDMRTFETGELGARAAPPPPMPPAFVSAFYLPQFHPTPENDAWWGTGYTEWTAVTRAQPNFAGHVQPALPADLGFYDLRVPETMAAQWRMAEAAGVDAFCAYHYWFDGRRLLEAPLDGLLARPEIPFRFYLCWANEAWRRNWDGLSGEILLDQSYGEGFESGLVASTLPYFADPRYARPDGKRPRFVIYRPTDIPDPAASVARMRAAWAAAGHPEVELGAVLFHVEGESPVAPELFDFWIEMPPHGLVEAEDYLVGGPNPPAPGLGIATDFHGLVYDYDAVIRNSLGQRFRRGLAGRVIAGIMPSWDNTARRRRGAHLAHGANPIRFRKWLQALLRERLDASYRRELFVNAWNEWAEKAVLEPGVQYGHAPLDVLREAVRGAAAPAAAPSRAKEVEHV